MDFSIVILAAGKGTRMQSTLPKVLHPIAGVPMLAHIVQTAQSLHPKEIIIVYGAEGKKIREAFNSQQYQTLTWVEQTEQKGTGHAVQQVLPIMQPCEKLLIWYGDVPLVSKNTLERFLQETNSQNCLSLITVHLKNPKGLGRILRDEAGTVTGIIEEKDANEAQKKITEIWPGLCLVPTEKIKTWLARIDNNNAQKEYYLTDIVACAVKEKMPIKTIFAIKNWETQGVNDKAQLAFLEREYQLMLAYDLLLRGVSLIDPARLDIRNATLQCGQDLSIDINVILEGTLQFGNQVSIGANCIIKNTILGDNVTIHPHSIIEDAVIEDNAIIGPFARLRPNAKIGKGVKIGNFVEIKNSIIGENSKINHLSYIGDAKVGKTVNIGAGTITCNYDGAQKHPTQIEDGASIGANSQLIAPVKIGVGATIGAGTTLIKDAPAYELTINPLQQIIVPNWKRKIKLDEDTKVKN